MKLNFALGFCLLIVLGSCQQLPESPDAIVNPLDTSHSSFIFPATTIASGPAQSDTVRDTVVTFAWNRTKDADSSSYRFDDTAWSPWTGQNSVTIGYLDEGPHTFTVRAKHKNNQTIEANPPTRTFVVDAVHGPSVMFLPRRKIISPGDHFMYSVKAEEVTGLFASRLAVKYNPNFVQVDSVRSGDFLTTNRGIPILFVPPIDSVNGKLEIDMFVAGSSVSGSGMLATMYCTARLSTPGTEFAFDPSSTAYRDTLDSPMTIQNFVKGEVVVR